MKYSGLLRATECIALDNGGINRYRPLEQQQKEALAWIERQPTTLMEAVDAWLSTLSDEDLETVCCGEFSAAQELLASAPPFTDDTLNNYFDEVC